MLLVAIGYGNGTDPFTCSHKVIFADKEFHVLAQVFKKLGLYEQAIDEILVIENDEVIAKVARPL